jgi:CRISPR-associated protein Csd1
MVCLLTGDATAAAKTHEKVSGLKRFGGRGQDIVVGCDKPAFKSFGLEQGENSAMSEPVAKAYVEALDYLLANQCRSLETAAVVYWFKEQVPPADDPFALLYGLDSDETQAATASIQAKALLDSIRSGKRQDLASNHFYAMTMSGASGRVMLRDWMEGQFEQLVAHIHAWFDALSIVNREGQQLAPDPKFRAVVGALAAKELKEVPGSITSVLWHAALAEQPIPQPVMAQVLNRYRLSVVKDETPLHARLGLLKAYFVRKPQGGDPLMKPYLNPDHPNPAYQCGRLLAVLAQLQHAALGDVGAGVVQRFYPAASQTPGLTLGRLVANARNHLRKLDGGLAWWFEERIGEIMGRLRDEIPRTQNLEEQGLFALGYYQQLAALKAGKKSVDTSSEQ